MAIDYGTKRVGIAVSDPMRIIATALTTVHSKDILTFLEYYFEKEKVDAVVVGEPKTLANEDSSSAVHVNSFVKKMADKFPGMEIIRLDERFTSRIAQQVMLNSGLKKKDRQDKGMVDQVSAVILLQDYMERLTNNL